MSVFDELLPVGRRPRCRYCRKELKPNYDTRRDGTFKIKRVFVIGARASRRSVDPSDLGAKQEANGLWYVEHKIPNLVRAFKGTYGRDNLFCGLMCGYRWAQKHAAPGSVV